MSLPGEQRKKLHDAVLNAIDDHRELERIMLHGMNVRLKNIIPLGSLHDVLFELLDWLESEGRMGDFIKVLRQEKPRHQELRRTLDEIEGVETTPVRIAVEPTGINADIEPTPNEAPKEQSPKASLIRLAWAKWNARTVMPGWLGPTTLLALCALFGVGIMSVAGRFGGEVIEVKPNAHSDLGSKNGNKNPSLEDEPKDGPRSLPIWQNAYSVGKYVVYFSPEHTYNVLKERIDGAQKSILIAMYEFSSTKMKDLLLSAMNRGVKVTLLTGSRSQQTMAVAEELAYKGAEVTMVRSGFAPPFKVYHPKTLIIDGTWTLVQSANLTDTGIPAPRAETEELRGNVEAGVAFESKELAAYFESLLKRDIEQIEKHEDGGPGRGEVDPVYQPRTHVQRLPLLTGDSGGSTDKTTTGASRVNATSNQIRVVPVLTPDNYINLISQLLASAQQSIDVEQAWIKPTSDNVKELLKAIKSAQAKNPKLRVRIILSYRGTRAKDLKELKTSYGWSLGDTVRILDPSTGLHLSNKLIIVDDKVSLVGSANWSEFGTTKNREINLLIDSKKLSQGLSTFFERNWNNSGSKIAAEFDERSIVE